MTRRTLRKLGCAAGATLFAGAAHAQITQGFHLQPQSSAGMAQQQLQGVSSSALQTAPTPGLVLQLEGVYDTNVSHGRPTFGGTPLTPQDEIFTPEAQADLQRAFGRESGFLIGDFGYSFYRQNSVLNRLHFDSEGGVNAPIGPCKSTLSGAFSRHQTDLSEFTVAVPNNEDLETVSLQGDCSQTIGVAPLFTVSQGWAQNSAAERAPLDRSLLSAEGGVAYTRPTIGQVELFGDYTDVQFPKEVENINGEDITAGFKTYSGGLKYTRMLGARIQGQAQISYEILRAAVPGTPEFNGVTYQVSLQYNATSRIQVGGLFSRGTNPSNRIGSLYSTGDVYSGQASYAIGARLRLQIGADYRNLGYFGQLVPGVTDLTHETDKELTGALTFDLTRRLSLALNVERQSRDANLAQYSYSATRVGLTAAARF